MEDLHVHTKYSDGEHTPKEVVKYAKEHGLSKIAITDHDSVSGLEEALYEAQIQDIECIPAIEFSTDQNKSHILGYNIDYKQMEKDPEFNRIQKLVFDTRRERAKKVTESTKNDPLTITDKHGNKTNIYADFEDVDKIAKGVITSGHTAFILSEKIKKALGLDIGMFDTVRLFMKGKFYDDYSKSIKQVFKNYDKDKVEENKTLFDYISFGDKGVERDEKGNVLGIKKWKTKEYKSAYPQPKEVIDLIHKYGGIAVLAHPGENEGKTREQVEDIIKQGIDGMELYTPKNKEKFDLYQKIADDYNLIISGGSDWHGVDFTKHTIMGCISRPGEKEIKIPESKLSSKQKIAA